MIVGMGELHTLSDHATPADSFTERKSARDGIYKSGWIGFSLLKRVSSVVTPVEFKHNTRAMS